MLALILMFLVFLIAAAFAITLTVRDNRQHPCDCDDSVPIFLNMDDETKWTW